MKKLIKAYEVSVGSGWSLKFRFQPYGQALRVVLIAALSLNTQTFAAATATTHTALPTAQAQLRNVTPPARCNSHAPQAAREAWDTGLRDSLSGRVAFKRLSLMGGHLTKEQPQACGDIFEHHGRNSDEYYCCYTAFNRGNAALAEAAPAMATSANDAEQACFAAYREGGQAAQLICDNNARNAQTCPPLRTSSSDFTACYTMGFIGQDRLCRAQASRESNARRIASESSGRPEAPVAASRCDATIMTCTEPQASPAARAH